MHQHNHTSEGPRISRRTFLGTSAVALGASGLARVSLASPLLSPITTPGRDAIISIYLRGGMDGLSAIAPYADPNYATGRGSLALPPPGPTAGSALDLDGFFGINSTGMPLLRPYGDGNLLFVHGCGLAAPNRSHFDAQRRMERGATDNVGVAPDTGWLGRHLQSSATGGTAALRGIAINNILPETLVGGPETLPVREIADYAFPGRAASSAARRAILDAQYQSAPALLGDNARSALSAVDLLNTVDYSNYMPAAGAQYPGAHIGSALRQVAAMVKANICLESAQINMGGWDHHSDHGPVNGQFAGQFGELSAALEALYVDLQSSGSSYTVIVQTEFGRRVAGNGSGGTDHGFGGCMMLMGPSVTGGRVLTQWPGLRPESSPGAGDGDLVNGDLDVTIDWRDVAAEVLQKRAGNTALADLFPGYSPTFQSVCV